MYVVSFYSFKGGVGRTMALVNTAYFLAAQAKRVLIVDFDLEAPSVPTYGSVVVPREQMGLVDYVQSYIESNKAPVASDYIFRLNDDCEGISVMPAGRSIGGYGSRLQSIDWANLYDSRNGFLLMEDLKAQWQSLGFDYVLLDSRTGHTDVAGICTRQLPNLVVCMFIPNDQNISGLEEVVQSVRTESLKPSTFEPIDLIFVPSNVPDLDDEKGILRDLLERAKHALNYEEHAVIIHHYPSLDVLAQKAFVVDRPRSKLGLEYKALGEAIVRHNLSDRSGALEAILDLIKRMQDSGGRPRAALMSKVQNVTSQARSYHPNDPEIGYNLARLYSIAGDIEAERSALSAAINGGFMVNDALRRRAAALLQLDLRDEGVSDLRQILSSNNVEATDFIAAVEMLRAVDKNWVSATRESPSLLSLDPRSKVVIAEILHVSRSGMELSSELCRQVLNEAKLAKTVETDARGNLVLALVSTGRYEEAIEAVGATRASVMVGEQGVPTMFNYAMAEWGLNGTPPEDMFRGLIETVSDRGADANFYQCLALANFVIGDKLKGLANIEASRRSMGFTSRHFSCWTYLLVRREMFTQHLAAIEEQGVSGNLTPPLFQESRQQKGLLI